MPLTLVVSEPFGPYQRGDQITDPVTIAAIRGGEDARRVVQVSDEIVPPPPTEPVASPLAGVLASLALVNQRLAALEALPPPPPPPVFGQQAGAALVDGDGTQLNDGDGDLLVR
jgi:hypothetical protein